jgi:hypothetical protein
MGPKALLSLRRKACWGFFCPEIRRLPPGANAWTWVPKASTLPLDHRSGLSQIYYFNLFNSTAILLTLSVKLPKLRTLCNLSQLDLRHIRYIIILKYELIYQLELEKDCIPVFSSRTRNIFSQWYWKVTEKAQVYLKGTIQALWLIS